MNIEFCSMLAANEGEPIDGTAPEKDSAIFFPAHKSAWHQRLIKEDFQQLYKDTELGQTIALCNRPLVCYYSPYEQTGNQIFVADSSGITCFLQSGLKVERHIKRLYAICTDGKKDACCAKFGIQVARAFLKECERDHLSLSIETSHIGGCRFAATTVCFPSGNSYGRILPKHACNIKRSEEAGFIVSNIFRGNVFFSEIQCWIMRHSMDNFGYAPTPAETSIVVNEDLIHITITPSQRPQFRFDLTHYKHEFRLFSGCSNIQSGRSIIRSIYDFVHPIL